MKDSLDLDHSSRCCVFCSLLFCIPFYDYKKNLKTPGREDDSEETKLFTKQTTRQNKGSDASAKGKGTEDGDEKSILITRGLGGKKNIQM